MSRPVRLLLVEDSERDAALLLRHLKREGFDVEARRVDSLDEVEAALGEAWDAILCDYSLSGFDARAVLAAARARGVTTPVIVVSGVIGEEAAVDCLRDGARDFVLKEHLARLGPALGRELEESATRSKLKTSEAMLERAEKLRSLGQMAAGISHDLKNILNPLSLFLQIATRSLDANRLAEVREALAEMKSGLARGVQVIDRLRDYSRQSPESAHQRVDLKKIAIEASELARPRVGRSAGVEVRLVQRCAEVGPILGHQADLVSAVLNLLVNAVDALPKGGTITIETDCGEGRVWLSVGDDGVGIPRDVREHIFEPFFTTKGEEGTGLGLPMVYACVVRHGGEIFVRSEVDKGTTFTLRFPSAPSSE